MKILHLSALPIWSMGGKGGMPSLQETLKGHLREGCEIEVVLPKYDLFSDDINELPIRIEEGYTVHVASCRWLPILKIFRNRVSRISGRNSIPYPLRWLINVSMLFALTFSLVLTSLKVCRRGGFSPQLIYAHNQYAAMAGFIISRVIGKPNVTRLYGTFLADLMKRPFVFLRYPTAAAGYLVPSNLLICGNDGTRGDEVAAKFKVPDQRFRFWQNGVDPPSEKPAITRELLVKRFGPKLRPESKWAVSCSRLSDWKRIDRMLYAIRYCKEKKMDCQLLVAGDGPEKENLRILARNLAIEDSVIWMGAVSHDDIWGVMNVADVFMITNDVTNRCNPLYEAAWANLPVVSVFDPSTSDLLKDGVNALLAEKENTKDLGKKLVMLCDSKALIVQLKNEQKKISSYFWTWEERMKVELQELRKLIMPYRANRS